MEKFMSSAENIEVNRFDNLLNLIKTNIEQENNGWISASSVKINMGDECITAHFYAFDPKPLPEEFESSYSPSILLELGEYAYDDDGRPNGEVSRYFVKRRHLIEEFASKENRQMAESNLAFIEEVYFACQNGTPLAVV